MVLELKREVHTSLGSFVPLMGHILAALSLSVDCRIAETTRWLLRNNVNGVERRLPILYMQHNTTSSQPQPTNNFTARVSIDELLELGNQAISIATMRRNLENEIKSNHTKIIIWPYTFCTYHFRSSREWNDLPFHFCIIATQCDKCSRQLALE